MKFEIERSIEILERTPVVLEALLSGISQDWQMNNEGENTFSPYDVLGHLIHGEKTDWAVRMKLMLSENPDRRFKPFDRFAQFAESKGKSMEQLLKEFRLLRKENVELLTSLRLSETDLMKTGVHPEFGSVSLVDMLAAWTVHDLGHIAQIARVMAKQYKDAVGPWIKYLTILTK